MHTVVALYHDVDSTQLMICPLPTFTRYFTSASLTTVGFGDRAPQTPWGRVFTIFYILIGLGLIGNCVAEVFNVLLDAYKARVEARAEKKKKNEMDGMLGSGGIV